MNRDELQTYANIEDKKEFENILRSCGINDKSEFSQANAELVKNYAIKLKEQTISTNGAITTSNNNVMPGFEKKDDPIYVVTKSELLEFGKDCFERGRKSKQSTFDKKAKESLLKEACA